MQLLNRVLCSAAMLLTLGLSAETVKLTDAAAWANKPSPAIKFEDGVLSITGRQALSGKTVFEIDPDKTYRISCQVRAVGNDAQTISYIGYYPLDANKKILPAVQVNTQGDTDGVLAEDANKGDKTLKIKLNKPQPWKNIRNHWRIAFDAQADFSDLPNAKLSPSINPDETKLEGDTYEVALNAPMTFSATAGTAVRAHAGGGSMYVWYAKAKPEWQTLSFVTKGHSARGLSGKQFWKGSKFFKMLVFGNWYSLKTKPVLEIKDFQLEILD